jgi:hypothetical protein
MVMDIVNVAMSNFVEQLRVWNTYRQVSTGIDYSNRIDYFSKLPCYHYTDIHSINSSNSNVLVIDNLTEGLHSKHYFAQYDKTKHYIIISNDTWNNVTDSGLADYTLIWQPFFLLDFVTTATSPFKYNFYTNKLYDFNYPKANVFMSTTGNVRPDRTHFMDQVLTDIPYNNFIYRYSGEDFGKPSNDLDLLTFKKGEFDPYTSYINSEQFVSVSQTIPIDLYNSAYFNLVVETDHRLDNFFLTEKTVKCLVTGIPFVALSTANFLTGLHKLGFKTYSTIWNESYDMILNFEDRVEAIRELVHSLGNLDWKSKQDELEQIANHNARALLGLDKLANKCFNTLMVELNEC